VKPRRLGYLHSLYTACLLTTHLSLVPIAPTHEGMARLSWTEWLVKWCGREWSPWKRHLCQY